MEMEKDTKQRKYKIAAAVGTVIMGIGAFMGCLSTDAVIANTGNGLLLVSIAIMVYGYSKWQP